MITLFSINVLYFLAKIIMQINSSTNKIMKNMSLSTIFILILVSLKQQPSAFKSLRGYPKHAVNLSLISKRSIIELIPMITFQTTLAYSSGK